MTTLFSLHLQSYAVNANGGEVVISSIAQKTVHVHLDATDEMTWNWMQMLLAAYTETTLALSDYIKS